LGSILNKSIIIRFFKFGAVGLLGVGVNLGAYTLLYEWFGLKDFLARILAIEISVLNNFAFNYLWTWGDRGRSWAGLPIRLLRYHGSTFISSFVITLGIGWLVLQALPEQTPWMNYISHSAGIVAGMIVNYLMSDRWVFTMEKGV